MHEKRWQSVMGRNCGCKVSIVEPQGRGERQQWRFAHGEVLQIMEHAADVFVRPQVACVWGDAAP